MDCFTGDIAVFGETYKRTVVPNTTFYPLRSLSEAADAYCRISRVHDVDWVCFSPAQDPPVRVYTISIDPLVLWIIIGVLVLYGLAMTIMYGIARGRAAQRQQQYTEASPLLDSTRAAQ